MKKLVYILLSLFSLNIAVGQVPIDTAVNFSVKDIHGNTINLFSILDDDKLVVIDFFSTSCGPCGLYAPDFQASYEDFGENQGNVFFVGICWGDDNAGVAYFDSLYGLSYPSVSGSQGGGNGVHNAYQVMSTPTVIIINPEREIVENFIWEPTLDNLNSAISAAGGSLVGLDENRAIADELVKLYPNPSTGMVHMETRASGTETFILEVYNLLGARVYTSGKEVAGDEGIYRHDADLGSLPGGTYFLRLLRDGTQEKILKLVLLY